MTGPIATIDYSGESVIKLSDPAMRLFSGETRAESFKVNGCYLSKPVDPVQYEHWFVRTVLLDLETATAALGPHLYEKRPAQV